MTEPNTDSKTSSPVEITGSNINASIHSVADAKNAIKELKLKKKEYGNIKKNIVNQQKQIRAEYTHEVRTRGRNVAGAGTVGVFAHEMERIARENRRVKLANDLAPLEKKKQEIDAMLSEIANEMLQLEMHIIKQQSIRNE